MTEDATFMKQFKEDLRKHLSDEYIELSDKKEELQMTLSNLNQELDNQNRTLFSGIEKSNVKKYFSPLNIPDETIVTIDDRSKALNLQISNVKEEISGIDVKLDEIRKLMKEADKLI